MKRRIAIVEDEPTIRENYREALSQYGYTIDVYSDRPSAWVAFEKQRPDLAIIDVGLADEPEGGFDLCRDLRAMAPNCPIIFLTARDHELDVISGLRLGADDYLSKDISLPHLGARVVALFRRMDAMQDSTNTPDQIIESDALLMNLDRMTARWKDQSLDLTVTEFWILHALARHPGHVKNRQQLMDAANVVLDDNTITSHVKRIRKKFQTVDTDFDAIQTVYGAGYRWHSNG